MVSLGRFGLSLFSIAPSFSYNSNSATSETKDTKAIVETPQPETTESLIKKANEKIRELTMLIQENHTKFNAHLTIYNNATKRQDRFEIENTKREMRVLYDQKNELEKQRNFYIQQQQKMTAMSTATDRVKMTVSCLQATNAATQQYKTEFDKIKDFNHEESEIALYEMMEQMEEKEYILGQLNTSSSSSRESNYEFESYLTQQKAPTIPLASPSPSHSSSIPSYLSSTKTSFPEFSSLYS
jgi:hypothetical protein